MSPTASMALALIVAGLVATPVGRAQRAPHPDGHVHDWLAWWPPCAQADLLGTPRPGEDRLLYPRPGLPAVLSAGQRLTTRVHLAAPLTPPPGVQQERALSGWGATLHGRATMARPEVEHRYALRVDDIRVDGQGGPVYRASVDLPPWVAPGTYDLLLRVPGGQELAAVASVRVIAGEAPSLRPLPASVEVDALRWLDVDVWIAPAREVDDRLRRPVRGRGLPWLDAELAPILLKLGEDGVLARRPGCDDPAVPFARALADLGGQVRDPAAVPGEPVDARVRVEPAPDGWRVSAEGLDARVSVLLPERPAHQVEVEGGALAGAWPSTPVAPAGHRPGVLVWLTVPAGQIAQVRVAVTQVPEVALLGEAVARSDRGLRVELAPATAFDVVALGWEERGAAFGPASAPPDVRFRWMERQEVHALALRRDGATARASHAVFVHPRRPSACAVGAMTTGPREAAGNWWILGALCTIAVRRYTSAGRNAPRPGATSPRREEPPAPRTFAPRP
ncbi:MAG: hypothetical protein KF901_29040 [Myxococcales bacterium]|nr:hypothetical protein [Myxococcales bacterium]